jgi:hypothetical protein
MSAWSWKSERKATAVYRASVSSARQPITVVREPSPGTMNIPDRSVPALESRESSRADPLDSPLKGLVALG